MRRDTQIGIILGIVILVIIGVFLSTRTPDNETVIQDLVLSERDREKSEIEEIDINEVIKDSEKTEREETPSVEYSSDETRVSEELVKSIQPEEQPERAHSESLENDTSLEGKWEGVAEEILEEPEIAKQEETAIPEKKQQTPSYNITSDTTHKVQANDSLFEISRKYYGDGKKWTKIFEANRDSMPDPDSLYVGQELLIPDSTIEKETNQVLQSTVRKKSNKERTVNVNTHTVKTGDTLYRLAEEYYDDPTVWIKIYEANENTIEDKELLIEGQKLIIPQL